MAATPSSETQDIRYPIGPYHPPTRIDDAQRRMWIDEIEGLPAKLRTAVGDLTDEQVDTPYREGGWTVRQVVHHLPDSHMNSYTRFRLALTEDSPIIKPYNEAAWAELRDARSAPISISLTLLEALHKRWILLLRSMTEADFARIFQHPEMGPMRLDKALSLYAWHSRHHLAQITSLRSRRGW
ncbi:MAG: bacillithiol transferase BstA [Acidobacteriota bacterium]|nr:bacillithiol transferase BstA [Acidobacteriota bacterium]MDQ2841707.1 bacillithiol transferase BstA [Acidobacteriota bacterium]